MIRKLTALLAVLLAPLSYSVASGAGPSFDCAKAGHDIEELVCADPGLAALDRRLADTYAAALKNYPPEELESLKTTQRGWIKGRNDCWKADDQRACAEYAYRSRITELQITAGILMVPEAVNYVCAGGPHETLTAVFYRDSALPAVVLTRVGGPAGGTQVIAFLQPSGSGAKYVGGNTVFWEHHGEAMLEMDGKTTHCKAR